MHFATPAMQAPKYAQPGQDSRELWLRLELRVIADVGLLGFPNAGKSSLLSMCSNARPEIANYHFTTLTPQLGVVGLKGDRSFVMADIPGLIEGASEGVGLGYQFLRHIERCRVLIHVVDLAGTEGRDPAEDIETLRRELRSYDEHLLERPMLIAANKVDLLSAEEERERLDILREKYGDRMEVCPISAAANTGIGELLEEAWRLLERAGRERRVYESEFDLSSIGNEELLPLEYGNPKPGFFTVEGPKIEKMLGYTNLESEKGFAFFQRFMEEQGIIKRLKRMGLKEGDSIRIYGHEFEYLDSEGDDFPASEKEEE